MSARADLLTGQYRGEIDTPGGPVCFIIELATKEQELASAVHCGGETWSISQTSWDGQDLVFDIPEFDAKIVAKQVGHQRFEGHYQRTRSATSTAKLPFRMQPVSPDPPLGASRNFGGKWRVKFADSDQNAVGEFVDQGNGRISGTILTTTGDYRYLDGVVDAATQQLRLSAFDGGHVFLLNAQSEDAQTMAGTFYSGDWYQVDWTATRDSQASLPNAFGLARLREDHRLSQLAFPDSDGHVRQLSDPNLIGTVTIIELFGTWCPNCHDATRLLSDLQQQYSESGLRIVGLAFELTGNEQRDRQQLKRYVERFGVTYPVLLAGISDKEQAAKKFPLLEKVIAYPTFLFVDANGVVRSIYVGFSGPASGHHHEELRLAFQREIESLLETQR